MTRQPAIKTGLTPSCLAWRTPKAEGSSSWMGRPAQEPSKLRPVAPQLFQNRRTARGPLTGEISHNSEHTSNRKYQLKNLIATLVVQEKARKKDVPEKVDQDHLAPT